MHGAETSICKIMAVPWHCAAPPLSFTLTCVAFLLFPPPLTSLLLPLLSLYPRSRRLLNMEGAVAPVCEFGSSFSVLYFQLLYPFIESPSLQTGRL